MRVALVLTIIGRDRPGLVESLASMVTRHDGNWLESRMNRLGGEFAGLLRCDLPPDREDAFRQALAQLDALTAVVRRDQPAPAPTAPLATLDLVGHDRPGIVRQLAAILAAQGVNVEELATECVSAPMSGEPLFKARARLALPPGLNLASLRTDLERVAADLLVEIAISPVTPPA
ncbi:MAG: glycine cleavage system protein R [Verrucomicrobiae bacterium]|nr:glycine cleavage system protein R [Verrucomicrobiae bacterium]